MQSSGRSVILRRKDAEIVFGSLNNSLPNLLLHPLNFLYFFSFGGALVVFDSLYEVASNSFPESGKCPDSGMPRISLFSFIVIPFKSHLVFFSVFGVS